MYLLYCVMLCYVERNWIPSFFLALWSLWVGSVMGESLRGRTGEGFGEKMGGFGGPGGDAALGSEPPNPLYSHTFLGGGIWSSGFRFVSPRVGGWTYGLRGRVCPEFILYGCLLWMSELLASSWLLGFFFVLGEGFILGVGGEVESGMGYHSPT